jgi:hypothetical protein
MNVPPLPSNSASPNSALGWQRLRLTIAVSAALGFLLSPAWTAPTLLVMLRAILVGLVAMLAFSLLERWPRRLPRWLGRWVLQVISVAVVTPFAVFIAYLLTTGHDATPLWQNKERLQGMGMMMGFGVLLVPWITMTALLRQRDSTVRNQAQAFALERMALERSALDARLRLLQAQVAPHFLFNTLANIRELVDSGSEQASGVLDSLIAYLRAAVPRLHESATTIGQEMQLVRAYLDLMHMRMPDRLNYSVQAEETVMDLRCPATTVLSLVENAVRHGIDPSEDGGDIEIRVLEVAGRCRVQVSDSGLGLRPTEGSLGTGLANLRERLQLVFGDAVGLRLAELRPRGVLAEVEFPAQRVAP